MAGGRWRWQHNTELGGDQRPVCSMVTTKRNSSNPRKELSVKAINCYFCQKIFNRGFGPWRCAPVWCILQMKNWRSWLSDIYIYIRQSILCTGQFLHQVHVCPHNNEASTSVERKTVSRPVDVEVYALVGGHCSLQCVKNFARFPQVPAQYLRILTAFTLHYEPLH